MEYLRNKQTGEIKPVERDTTEWVGLTSQVGPDGRSLWEQTGAHHVEAIAERAEAGALREEDLGNQDQPVAALVVDTEDVGPAVAPWLELTAAEREMGLTPEQKRAELADDIGPRSASPRSRTRRSASAGPRPSSRRSARRRPRRTPRRTAGRRAARPARRPPSSRASRRPRTPRARASPPRRADLAERPEEPATWPREPDRRTSPSR
jgi:hypothetical protein